MFLEDENNKLWLATSDGLYSYDKQTQTVKEYNASNSNMPGNIVYGIYQDSSNAFGWVQIKDWPFWIAQVNVPKIFCPKLSEKKLSVIYMKEETVHSFFGQLNNRLFISDKSLNHFRYLSPICPSIVQDDQGYYWLGQWDGLLRVNEKLDRFTFFPAINDLAANAGPPISKDKNGLYGYVA